MKIKNVIKKFSENTHSMRLNIKKINNQEQSNKIETRFNSKYKKNNYENKIIEVKEKKMNDDSIKKGNNGYTNRYQIFSKQRISSKIKIGSSGKKFKLINNFNIKEHKHIKANIFKGNDDKIRKINITKDNISNSNYFELVLTKYLLTNIFSIFLLLILFKFFKKIFTFNFFLEIKSYFKHKAKFYNTINNNKLFLFLFKGNINFELNSFFTFICYISNIYILILFIQLSFALQIFHYI